MISFTKSPMIKEEYEQHLASVKDWKVIDGKAIEKDFTFVDFQEAIDFINKIAEIAETQGHHPDLLLYSWNKVKVTLSSHSVGGLSESDFSLAIKIDQI